MHTIAYSYTKHYETLCSWWRAHDWQPVGAEFLPQGFIACIGTKPIAAGFVYETLSKLFIMDWIVADPKSDKNIRKQGIYAILEAVDSFSKEKGAKALVSFSKNNNLTEKLTNFGYEVTDKGMDVLTRRL